MLQHNLSLAFEDDIPKMMVALYWDPNEEPTGVLGDITPHNADLICAVINENIRVMDVITPQNPKRDSYKGQIYHKGDSLSGGGDYEDEEIIINFDALGSDVKAIAFAVSLHHSVKFSDVKNGKIAFKNMNNFQDFLEIPFTELDVDLSNIKQTRTRYTLVAYIHKNEKGQWLLDEKIDAMDNIDPDTFEALLKG